MFISRWTEKEYVVYMYNGILFRLKKENLAICDYIGEFEEYYAKWNKSDREWKILKNIAYYLYMNSREAKLIVTEWWPKESGAGV